MDRANAKLRDTMEQLKEVLMHRLRCEARIKDMETRLAVLKESREKHLKGMRYASARHLRVAVRLRPQSCTKGAIAAQHNSGANQLAPFFHCCAGYLIGEAYLEGWIILDSCCTSRSAIGGVVLRTCRLFFAYRHQYRATSDSNSILNLTPSCDPRAHTALTSHTSFRPVPRRLFVRPLSRRLSPCNVYAEIVLVVQDHLLLTHEMELFFYTKRDGQVVTPMGRATVASYREADQMLVVTLPFCRPSARMWIPVEKVRKARTGAHFITGGKGSYFYLLSTY